MSEASAAPLMRAGCALLGLSTICIAAICLYNHDFAGPREPVPLGWPLRPALIALNIAVFASAGAALLVARWRRYGAIGIAAWLGLWTVALHLPKIFAGEEAAWLGAAECLAIAAAAARAAPISSNPAIGRGTDIVYALCLFAFGAAHFIYVQITASMVPSWLAEHIFWACFTGAAHVAAGVSLLLGVWTRLATHLLAAMLAIFTLLVNLPVTLAKGGLGNTTLDLCFAVTLTASAVIMAAGRR